MKYTQWFDGQHHAAHVLMQFATRQDNETIALRDRHVASIRRGVNGEHIETRHNYMPEHACINLGTDLSLVPAQLDRAALLRIHWRCNPY